MKIALIGDVHANLPALETVLAHARDKGVDAIWNVGDFVGYGAFPEEVVQRLQSEEALSIVGNYDLRVLRFKQRKDKWRKSKSPEAFISFKWTYENLSKKSRKYLRFLSKEVRLRVKNRRILLTHGSPASNKEPITSETPNKRLRELARISKADVVVCGHSHYPLNRKIAGVRFINAGSVGRPGDGDPRACYAILHIGAKRMQVRHYRLEYDVERAVAAIRDNGLPESFAQMLLQGRSLETTLDEDLQEV